MVHDLIDHDGGVHLQAVAGTPRRLGGISHLAAIGNPGLAQPIVARAEVDRVDGPAAAGLDERHEDAVVLLGSGEIQGQLRLRKGEVATGGDDRIGPQGDLL